MSSKGKHSKKAADWSVRTADGARTMIFSARLAIRQDGSHVFTSRKGVIHSFAPGEVRHAERLDAVSLMPAGADDMTFPDLDEVPAK